MGESDYIIWFSFGRGESEPNENAYTSHIVQLAQYMRDLNMTSQLTRPFS